MSKTPNKNTPPEPFSALSFGTPPDPGTLSLSDSDPDLSDEAEVASLSVEEEEDEEQDSRETGGRASPVQPFSLKGMNSGFSLRSNSIFGGLLDVQVCSPLSQYSKKETELVSTSPTSESPNPEMPKEEEMALEPPKGSARLPSRKRRAPSPPLPDYMAHPERWTKYSLKDVPDTSERTNRNTALNFLAELKLQKEAKEASSDSKALAFNQDSSSSTEGKILFKRPQKKGQKGDEKSEAQSGQPHMAASWGDDGGEDIDALEEQEKMESLGFHGVKKRSRKNIRPKAEDKEEES